MKNISVFKNAGNQGYILMPRRLLNLLFAEHDDLDLFKLYAYLLLKATFVVTDNIDLNHGERLLLGFISRNIGTGAN